MTIDPVDGGGTAERTFQMSRFLAKAGIQCTLLTTDRGLSENRIKALQGVKVIALPCIYDRFYIPMFSFKEIKNIVENADIIHLMSHWTIINAIIYIFARCLNKPYVICPAGELVAYGKPKFSKRLFSKVIGNKIIKNASGYIAVTANEIPQFEAYSINSDNVTIIPNGINPEDFIISNNEGFRCKHRLGNHPYILFVGRLSSIKGPDLLLKAYHKAKDELDRFHLVFVGPDQGMQSELEEVVRANNLTERVHFIGYLGGADKAEAYHEAELLVISSRHEAMSIVALEAGITGTPVLLTDQCGFDEIVDINGGMVVPASVSGLYEGLVVILKDRRNLNNMGINLQKYVRDNYTWNSVVKKFIYLYDKIINQKIQKQ